MNEQLKKELIAKAGTFVISSPVLTNSRVIKAQDKAGVPLTAKQLIQFDQNK